MCTEPATPRVPAGASLQLAVVAAVSLVKPRGIAFATPNTRIAASGLAMGLVPKGWRSRNAHVTGVAGAFASQATICAPGRSRRRDRSHT
jgi:hypothetical protein